MTNAGTAARERFHHRMGQVAVGATLVSKSRQWLVTKQQHFDTSVMLTLKCGRHQLRLNVPVCHYGPCLADVGLSAGAPAPQQRELFKETGQ
ncbi:hypothetical protein ACKZDW_02180 (plasmid) [Ralstonia syzygii subsp. celebesensis]|uniref:hypothetical protein n=1 Tax=Ralstonia syzygii TaxID=28097 RepID=UPI00387E1ED0